MMNHFPNALPFASMGSDLAPKKSHKPFTKIIGLIAFSLVLLAGLIIFIPKEIIPKNLIPIVKQEGK